MVASSVTAPAAPPAAPVAPPAAAADGVDVGALGVDAYSLLATARETVYAVAQARSQRRPELVADRVTGELGDALRTEAARMTAQHRHHVLAFLEVSGAVIVAAGHDDGGDRITVRMQLSGEEYELADGGLDVVDGTQTMRTWTEDWVFVRTAASDPWRATSSARVGEPVRTPAWGRPGSGRGRWEGLGSPPPYAWWMTSCRLTRLPASSTRVVLRRRAK
jgi:predicted lipid-binding transport protein (Tim44 family)